MSARAQVGQREGQYTWRPLTADRWNDLEILFGPNGASGGCWCMSYRLPRAMWLAQRADHGTGNREGLRELAACGDVAGILAYEHERPVGWCSIAPRDEYPTLDRSPLTRRRDDTPVRSLVCFYVGRAHRRRGVMAFLVRAAVDYVAERGGVIEAYPRRDAGRFVAGSGWVGPLPVFEATGFVEVEQPSPVRSIVRRTVSAATESATGGN